jgi:hypothetical protein
MSHRYRISARNRAALVFLCDFDSLRGGDRLGADSTVADDDRVGTPIKACGRYKASQDRAQIRVGSGLPASECDARSHPVCSIDRRKAHGVAKEVRPSRR